MATTFLCGFELGSVNEAISAAGSAFSVTFGRSHYALSIVSQATLTQALTFQLRPAGGTLINFVKSIRFFLQVSTFPGATQVFLKTAAVAAGFSLSMTATGQLVIADGTNAGGATSTKTLPIDPSFHRIDIDGNGTTRSVYVDGVLWVQATGLTSAAAQNVFTFGALTAVAGSPQLSIVIDDIAADDASIGAPTRADGNNIILLLPTTGINAGSWTDGAGGTGDIFAGVASVPPQGSAASTANIKIKNAASGTALDYVVTMQTYLAAGIPPGSIINAVQAVCNDGEEIVTGTKSGATWIASNPAQSAVTVGAGVGFDYGDDSGAVGSFFNLASGWITHRGVVSVAPSVTLGTAPTVTVRKGSSTTRVVDVDFMGLYVDYTPPPISKLIAANQAVKRANFF